MSELETFAHALQPKLDELERHVIALERDAAYVSRGVSALYRLLAERGLPDETA